jgi:hypothetical protein
VNKGRAVPYALGDGYGHFAVVVDDLEGEHARMEAEQLKPGPLREFQQSFSWRSLPINKLIKRTSAVLFRLLA